MTATPKDTVLEIEDLKAEFDTLEGVVQVLRGVDLTVRRGEAVGLVGESGSGKSVTAMSVLRLLREPPARLSGSIRFHGTTGGAPVDLAAVDPGSEQMQQIRGNDIAMIFQEPMSSLSPVFTIGHQVAEAIWLHQDKTRQQAHAEAVSQRLGQFRLTDAGGAPEQKCAGGLIGLAQTGAGALDRIHHRIDRFVLTKDAQPQVSA